jgi:imidazolonepropionase-like amidohydrolase
MRILIKNAQVFDGRKPKLEQNRQIIIEDNLVAAVTGESVAEENFGTVIDAAGRIAMPGLTDCHVHLSLTGETLDTALRVDEMAVRSVRFAKEILLRGFTSVRDAGGVTFGLKKNIDAGFLEGPRIFPSNAFLSQTCGHGDIRAGRGEERIADGIYASASLSTKASVLVDGVPEMLRAVRQQLFLGASQIKLMAGGGLSSAYDPLPTLQFTFEEIQAAVNAAADFGTYVMVHAYTPPAMQRAVKAGVKCLEHASWLDEETARMAAAEGIWLMPGPQFGRDYPGELPEAIKTLAAELRQRENTATEYMNKYDLPIVYGTDSLGDPARARVFQLDDFRFFKKRFGSVKGLLAATGNVHELLKLSAYQNPYPEGKIGVLEKGSFADLLLVAGNPAEDLDVLADGANITLIMKNGVIYKGQPLP